MRVGPENIIVNVHEKILCSSSAFFKNTMKPEWASSSAEPGSIELPDESVQVVRLYTHWLYVEVVPVKQDKDALKLLSRAYVFGEKFMDMKYKNAVLRRLIETMVALKTFPRSGSTNAIYEGTPSDSPARRLSVRFYAAHPHRESDTESWTRYIEGYSRDFLVDVLKEVIKVRPAAHTCEWMEAKDYMEQEEV